MPERPNSAKAMAPDAMSAHAPTRPNWHCGECGTDWPCESARNQLASELGPEALADHLAWLAEQAAIDLGLGTSALLRRRFLSWINAPDLVCQICATPNKDIRSNRRRACTCFNIDIGQPGGSAHVTPSLQQPYPGPCAQRTTLPLDGPMS